MTKWHRTRRGDFGLRALGVGACALSCLSIRHLMEMHDADPAHWSPGLFAYVLTAIGFLGASIGAAMTIMGRHLFDQVEISERWRRRPDGFLSASVGPADSHGPGSGLSGPGAPRPWGRRDPSGRREDVNLLLRRSSAFTATTTRHGVDRSDMADRSGVAIVREQA